MLKLTQKEGSSHMDSLSLLLLFNGINLIIVSYRFRPETPIFYDFH